VNNCKFGYIVFSPFGWICIISSRLFTYTFKDVKWYVLTNSYWQSEEFCHWFSWFRHANRKRLPAPILEELNRTISLLGM